MIDRPVPIHRTAATPTVGHATRAVTTSTSPTRPPACSAAMTARVVRFRGGRGRIRRRPRRARPRRPVRRPLRHHQGHPGTASQSPGTGEKPLRPWSGFTDTTWWIWIRLSAMPELGRREVEPPHPGPAGTHERDRFIPPGVEVGQPRRDRRRVVVAQALHVTGLEPRALDRRDDRADLVEVGIGEHVAVEERGPGQPAAPERRTAHRVVHEPPSRPQEPEHRGRVGVEIAAHVLEHADRADGVVGPVVDGPVVLVAHLHPVGEPRLRDGLAGPVDLLLGERDRRDGHTVLPRRVDRHRPPAAAAVEQVHARPQVELAADQLVLQPLCPHEVDARLGPERTGVGHGRPEQQLVELVRDVVVVADGVGLAAPRVQPAPKPDLLGWRRDRPEVLTTEGPQDRQPVGRREAGHRHPLAQRQHLSQVPLDREVARHVGAGHAELARRVQDAGQGLGTLHDHPSGGVGRPERRAVVELEPDRHIVAEETLHHGSQCHGATGLMTRIPCVAA